jgi:hypothetical protein
MVEQSNNIFNMWQTFCNSNNVDRKLCIQLYKDNKHRIRKTMQVEADPDWQSSSSTPKLINNLAWLDILRSNGNIVVLDGEQQQQQQQQTIIIDDLITLVPTIASTLKEIKQFLIYLSCEPTRKVRSYINLEDDCNSKVHHKWRAFVVHIMEHFRNTSNYSLKTIFDIIRLKLLDIQIARDVDIRFKPVDTICNKQLQLIFKDKRDSFPNELIVPSIVGRIGQQQHSTIYMLYDPREIFALIDIDYKRELSDSHVHSVLKVQFSINIENEFILTRLILIVLHAMLHLKCSLLYKQAFFSHESHLYFDLLEQIVPPPLYAYFLNPYSLNLPSDSNDTTNCGFEM